jgi:probable blue pigment (indigoidine) exporter
MSENTPVSATGWKFILAGLIFAVLWASASTATKIALESAQPFVIASFRFFIAGAVMLVFTHLVKRKRLPAGAEWKQLIIYGLLNVAIYLGIYVIAMQQVSAGLGSLAIAANPVFIALIFASWFSKKISAGNIVSLLLCFGGVMLAAFPLLEHSVATPLGILLLIISMLAYSIGTIYYSRVSWNGLDILTINGWQTIIGGFLLLPVLILTYHGEKNTLDARFWKTVIWLVVPVSIVAVQLWLYLVRRDAVKASYWLFLCPLFGFAMARLIMAEPITWYTAAGVLLVLTGLYIVQKK